jgi:hypothetical protein
MSTSQKSTPIDIPNIKRIDSKNEKIDFMYNSEELYYSSDLIFPPDNIPPDKSDKNKYVQILNGKTKISPSSYERFNIDKYF